MHAALVKQHVVQKHDLLIQRALTLGLLTLAGTLICAAVVLYV